MANRKQVKSFTSPEPTEVGNNDPIEIDVNGHVFEAYGDVPGIVTLDFIENSGSEDNSEQAKSIKSYLQSSFDPEVYKELDAVLRDPKKVVPMSVLSAIVIHLIEERGSRPTLES